MLAIFPISKNSGHKSRLTVKSAGFTLLEMVVVLVLLGVVSALAYPGLQQMYEAMSRALFRNELDSIFNSLALSVQSQGQNIQFRAYPDQAGELPPDIASRLEALGVQVLAEEPVYISASGLCPVGGQLTITKGLQEHTITLRSPDCKVSNEDDES